MATRRSSRSKPYDLDKPQNWTAKQLRDNLEKIHIKVSSASVSKATLLQLYLDNCPDVSAVTEVGQTISTDNVSSIIASNQDNATPSSTIGIDLLQVTRQSAGTGTFAGQGTVVPSATNATSSGDLVQVAGRAGTTSCALPAVASTSDTSTAGIIAQMAANLASLQQTVNKFIASPPQSAEVATPTTYTLSDVYNAQSAHSSLGTSAAVLPTLPFPVQQLQQQSVNTVPSQGVSMESLPRMELVSPTIQKTIIEGKDVNLASLLIPHYDLPQSKTLSSDGVQLTLTAPRDPRLDRALTIEEFLTAFGKYRRIVTRAFPHRHDELERYQDDLLEIYRFYGPIFYEYHKIFSRKAAEALVTWGIKVDWSKRDTNMLHLLTGGIKANTCTTCHSVDHATHFCEVSVFTKPSSDTRPSLASRNVPSLSQSRNYDRYGRKRVFHQGTELCNNFNDAKCVRNPCPLGHVCRLCKSAAHGASTCSPRSVSTAVTRQSAGTGTFAGQGVMVPYTTHKSDKS